MICIVEESAVAGPLGRRSAFGGRSLPELFAYAAGAVRLQ